MCSRDFEALDEYENMRAHRASKTSYTQLVKSKPVNESKGMFKWMGLTERNVEMFLNKSKQTATKQKAASKRRLIKSYNSSQRTLDTFVTDKKTASITVEQCEEFKVKRAKKKK